MFDLAKKSNESQIKGELSEAISFISEKFDAYEKESEKKLKN